MIEKEQVKELVLKKYKEVLRDVEDDVLDVEEEPDEVKRRSWADSVRNIFGRRIINALYGSGDKEFKDAWDKGGKVRQEIVDAVKEFLIEIYPVLDTEGVIAANATHIIEQIAEESDADDKKPETKTDEEISYEELSTEELSSLPEKVKEELSPFLELQRLLVEYGKGGDADLKEAIKELIQEAFNNLPKVKVLNFVVKLNLTLGGLGKVSQTKMVNFLNGVINHVQLITRPPAVPGNASVNPTTTGAPTNPNVLRRPGQKFVPSIEFPEHRDKGNLTSYYQECFEEAVEAGLDDEAYQFLIDAANEAMTQFLDSGSAQSSSEYGKKFLAMWDVLKDFDPNKIDNRKTRGAKVRSWGNKPDKYETDPKILHRFELAQRLFDKALELLFFSYIAEFAIKHGAPKSLVSDWSHLLEMEKADTDNFGVGVDMFDFFLNDGENKEHLKYKHSNIFTYLMWALPGLIREIEGGKWYWNDGYPKDHAEALEKRIKEEIEDIRKDVENKGTAKRFVAQHRNPDQRHPDQQPGKRELGRWGIPDGVEFTFSTADFEGLKTTDVEFDHLIKYINLYGTATGVRQHLFINDLARGSTPGGIMSDNKDWLIKCSRFALSNYQCYKGAIPHPLTEGFEISWPAKMKNGSPEFNPKQNLIITSILQTEVVLDRVMKIREERVDLGTLDNDVLHPLETSYPDLYSFVVRAHQRRALGEWELDAKGNVVYEDEVEYKTITLPDGRVVTELDDKHEPVVKKDKSGDPIPKRDASGNVLKKRDAKGNLIPKRSSKTPAKFEAFVAGLNALDDFVSVALKVPGGVSDKEKIRAMKPKELREAMLKDLVDLIQKKVSPMKANEKWINWRHVVQYILMFVDRMYRVYKLCDDTPEGRAMLTHEIRQTFTGESYNLAGITGSWIKDEGTVLAPEYEHGQAVRVSGLGSRGSDPRFGGVLIGQDGGKTEEAQNRKMDLRDWILSRLPEADNLGPKDRPIYGRVVGQRSGPAVDKRQSVDRVRGPVGSAFEIRGLLAIDNITHNGSRMFENLWHDYINVGAIPSFQKGIWQVIIGTPAEEQKKVADEQK